MKILTTKNNLYEKVRYSVRQAKASRMFQNIQKEKFTYNRVIPKRNAIGASRIYIEDLSEIPFTKNIPGIEYYQQRVRILAGTGDIVFVSHPIDNDYEEYNRNCLDLGRPIIIDVPPNTGRVIDVVGNVLGDYKTKTFFKKLSAFKKELHLHPYMGTKKVWELARLITVKYGISAKVYAPLPSICAFANDKTKFMSVVKKIVGVGYVPEYISSSNIDELSRNFKKFAMKYDSIVIKMPKYASSMGLKMFNTEKIRNMTYSQTKKLLLVELKKIEWDATSEVIISEWIENVVASPSLQLWIPPVTNGYPIIEGIYEQLLEGENKVFYGSMPYTVDYESDKKMKEAGFLLGIYLQQLGYVGRCSFDTIVTQDNKVYFVECNGRWGGTSLPMSFMHRLFPDEGNQFYMARDFISKKLKGAPFSILLKKYKDKMFDTKTGKGKYIFYNVGMLPLLGKLDIITLGKSKDECEYSFFEDFVL